MLCLSYPSVQHDKVCNDACSVFLLHLSCLVVYLSFFFFCLVDFLDKLDG